MKKNRCLSILFVLMVLTLLNKLYASLRFGVFSIDDWGVSEWLINYQGGFIRRGLIGEAIYQISLFTGLEANYLVVGLALIIFLILCVFFFVSFIKKGYPIFLLPLTLFLGNAILNEHWIRKDSLLLLILIGVVYAYLNMENKIAKWIVINTMLIIGVLMHEICILMVYPLLVLLVANKQEKQRGWLILKPQIQLCLCLLPVFVAFLIACIYKGGVAEANEIWASWYNIGGADSLEVNGGTAIGGLAWDAKHTLIYPSHLIFSFHTNAKVYPFFTLVILLVGIYHVLSNFNKFNDPVLGCTPRSNDSLVVSSALVFQFLFVLIPLLILGSDTTRWIYIWVCSSFSAVLLIPSDQLVRLFPQFIICIAEKLNGLLLATIGNSKGLLVLLSLCIGFPFVHGAVFTLGAFVETTPLNSILVFVSKFVRVFF